MDTIAFICPVIIINIITQIILNVCNQKKVVLSGNTLKINKIIKFVLFLFINVGVCVITIKIIGINISLSGIVVGLASAIIYDIFYNR